MTEVVRKSSRPLKQSARKAMSEGSLKGALTRKKSVISRVKGALEAIALEIEENAGVFPRANGVVYFAEVMRIANVDRKTLKRGNYEAFLKQVDESIKAFNPGVEALQATPPVPKPKRRTASQRLQAWKDQFNGLAQAHRDTELELQQVQSELEQSRSREAALNGELVRLNELLKGNKVVPIKLNGAPSL